MKITLILPLVAAFLASASVASAAPVPFIDVVGPHPDANGSATCADVIAGAEHVGACEGAPSCPIYYDDYAGTSGCLYAPTVGLGFLPYFELVGPHGDANGGGAQCSDVLATWNHVGVCVGNPGCPVYFDLYNGISGCL